MSGTSSDGVDLVLCKINDSECTIKDFISKKYPIKLKKRILDLNIPSFNNLDESKIVGNLVSKFCLKLIQLILTKNNLKSKNIKAIGFHGPTIRHLPTKNYSIQIGNEFMIANQLKIDLVHNFRNMDIASSGQGAPLIPIFHKHLLSLNNFKKGIFINIGGFSNISIIDKSKIEGFDIGPGNIFLDLWIKKTIGKNFDKDGIWASKGKVIAFLLSSFLKDPYFKKKYPKSTGRDYFNETWLKKFNLEQYDARDVQRTFLELTALLICREIKKFNSLKNLFICGGGFFNKFLIQRITEISILKPQSTSKIKINPQLVESTGFAWLAFNAVSKNKLDLHSITGTKSKNHVGIIIPT